MTTGSQYRGTREFLLVYCALIRAARTQSLIYYKEVASLIGVTQTGHHMARQVGQVLGEISEDEHALKRPMLSVVAVSEAGIPGDGFFVLARTLGRLEAPEDKDAFLAAERKRVYDTWADAASQAAG